MVKEALHSLQTGALAEIGLIAFFVAFVLVTARAFLMSRGAREAAKQMPLDEQDEINHLPYRAQPQENSV